MGKRQPNFKVGDLVGRRSIKSRIGIVGSVGPEPFRGHNWDHDATCRTAHYDGVIRLSKEAEGYPHQVYWFDIGALRHVTGFVYRDIYKLALPDD